MSCIGQALVSIRIGAICSRSGIEGESNMFDAERATRACIEYSGELPHNWRILRKWRSSTIVGANNYAHILYFDMQCALNMLTIGRGISP